MIFHCYAPCLCICYLLTCDRRGFGHDISQCNTVSISICGPHGRDPNAGTRPACSPIFPNGGRAPHRAICSDIRKAGFDFVRMPIDPAIFLEDASEERITRLIAETLETVDMLHAAGLKVIVDFHSIPERCPQSRDEPDPGGQRAVCPISGSRRHGSAKRCPSTDPATTAFEPFNEPVVDCDRPLFPKWPAMLSNCMRQRARRAQTHIDSVRRLLVQRLWAGKNRSRIRIADDNIIWTFHSYEPSSSRTRAQTGRGTR